jgi:hypothetical protein
MARKYTKAEIIKELRKIAKGGIITQHMAEEAKLYPTTVEDAFGKWRKAVKAAGLSMGKPGGGFVSRAQALADLIRVKATLGHNPTPKEYAKTGNYTHGILERHFGTYRGACKAVETALTAKR